MASEKRLIEADTLMKAIRDFRWIGVPNTLQLMFSYLKIIIRDQPTVDAVEVVRCKDCKWYNPRGGVAGQKTIICSYQPGDFFCAYGERKDNGQG